MQIIVVINVEDVKNNLAEPTMNLSSYNGRWIGL